MIQAAKKPQVFSGSEARIETAVAARVVPKTAANGAGVATDIMARKKDRAARWEKQSCENPKQGSLTGAVGSEKSHRLAFMNFKGDTAKGNGGGGSERLQKSAPTAIRRWE